MNQENTSNNFKDETVTSNLETTKRKKVVSGTARIKKQNGFSKAIGGFIADNGKKAIDYAVMDIIVPGFKEAISSIIKNGIDIILYGEAGNNRYGNKSNSVQYRNYREYSNYNSNKPRDYRSGVSKGVYSYSEIIFDSRQDAEHVLMAMDETLSQYGQVRVSDYYEFAEVTVDHSSYNYAWTDLRTATVVHTRDGWMIKLPRPLPID